MNTWLSWAARPPAGVVLRSVPPLVVVIAAEAVTDVQHALTQCVHCAHTTAHHTQQPTRPERVARAAVNGEAPAHPESMPPPHERTVLTVGERPVNISEQSVNPPDDPSGRQSVNPPRRVCSGHRARSVNPTASQATVSGCSRWRCTHDERAEVSWVERVATLNKTVDAMRGAGSNGDTGTVRTRRARCAAARRIPYVGDAPGRPQCHLEEPRSATHARPSGGPAG
jgi:hypothetical protein